MYERIQAENKGEKEENNKREEVGSRGKEKQYISVCREKGMRIESQRSEKYEKEETRWEVHEKGGLEEIEERKGKRK